MNLATTHRQEALTDSPSTVFLDALRDEQHRFLDSVRAAGAHVRDERGHIALAVAIQTRLTQQMFDAQRSLLKRQLAFDVEVARIEAGVAAAGTAHPALDAGTIGASRITLFPPPVAVNGDANRIDIEGRSDASRACDELADVREDAFEPVEIDPTLPQRELAELLEQWWNRVNADGQDMVDRALARARLSAHAVSVEATGSVVRIPQQVGTISSPSRHPSVAGSFPAPVMTSFVPFGIAFAGGEHVVPTEVGPTARMMPVPADRASFGPPVVLARPPVLPTATIPQLCTPPTSAKGSSTFVTPTKVSPAEAFPAPLAAPSAVLAVRGVALPMVGDGTEIDLADLLDALSRQLRPTVALPHAGAGDGLTIKLDRWEGLDNTTVLDRLSVLGSAPHQRRRRRSTRPPIARNLGAAVGPAAADDQRHPLDQLAVRTIVPLAAVTAVIAMVMALVG